MNSRRIKGMMVRHWYGTIRSLDRMTDSFYWITIDLLLWGITAGYVSRLAPEAHSIFFTITASVILWSVTYRGQSDISMALLDELWNKNLINLFASPLTFGEWIVSLFIYAGIKALISLFFGALVALVIYQFNFFTLSWHIIPFFVLLLLSGWAVGLLTASLVLRYTTKIQAVAWTFVWALAPFSAIYFPVSSLPVPLQFICSFLPMSYVFEEMRSVVEGGVIAWTKLGTAFFLAILYLIGGTILLKASFRHVLNRGLVKVY